jgi:hypothetical protein
MDKRIASVSVDDLMAASAVGVLRALEARKIGIGKVKVSDLVRDGFFVDVRIIAGGLNPNILNRLRQGEGLQGGLQSGGA